MTSVLEHPAPTATDTLPEHADVVIVGTGFSGLAAAVHLLADGVTDVLLLERADDVGGTWRDNDYPGCACDVPSHLYSFSFAPNPEWSSTFSPGPEIQAYLRRTAREQGLMPRIRLDCELEEGVWDDVAARWRLRTTRGAMTARVLVSAAGPLSDPSIPDLPGLGTFTGRVFHSARWDHEHDLDGARVAVVGTGASAIQFVPEIQPRVGRLHLFQRTPPWVFPRSDRPLTRAERALYRRLPAAQRAMRSAIYWAREGYAIPLVHGRLARAIAVVCRAHLRRQISDPALREVVTPDYLPGCKRILLSNDYWRSLDQPNVEVVPGGLAEVRERSVVAHDGSEREVDTIIFGTGFHVTDLPIAGRLTGRDGRRLDQHWDDGQKAFRGTTVAGFPNLFLLLGPNTGLGHNSVVFMAETQAGYVVDALRHMRERGVEALEVREEAQGEWNARVQRAMAGTVWTEGGCASWYLDRHGNNTTLWPSYTFRFRRRLQRFDAEHYVPRPAAPAGAPGPTAVAA